MNKHDEGQNRCSLSTNLRDRLASQMLILSRELESAEASSAPATLDAVREAADELMRAAARIVLEVERLRGVRRLDR